MSKTLEEVPRKLVESEVHEVRLLLYQGWGDKAISIRMNMTKSTVNKMRRGKRYKSIPVRKIDSQTGETIEPLPRRNSRRVFTEEKILFIKELKVNSVMSNRDIARLFSVSERAISNIFCGGKRQTWTQVTEPKPQIKSKIPSKKVRDMMLYCLHSEEFTQREVANFFGMSHSYVTKLLKRTN